MAKTGIKTWYVRGGTTTLVDFSTAFVAAPTVNGVGYVQATVDVERVTMDTFDGVPAGELSRFSFAKTGDVVRAAFIAQAVAVASTTVIPAPVPSSGGSTGSGGTTGPVTVASITDATAVGKSVLTSADAAAARTVLGAGVPITLWSQVPKPAGGVPATDINVATLGDALGAVRRCRYDVLLSKYPVRPVGVSAGLVDYVGPVEPGDWLDGDTWTDIS